MISAVDTNVLLDVLNARSPHHAQSREWLRSAYDDGAVLVCDVVYAELVPAFGTRALLDASLRAVSAMVSPIDTSIAFEAGVRWMRYRAAGGPRARIMADFLIGAHALASADSILTRDRGFYASYFPELTTPRR